MIPKRLRERALQQTRRKPDAHGMNGKVHFFTHGNKRLIVKKIKDKKNVRREFAAQKLAHRYGAAPKPIGYDHKQGILIQERVVGKVLKNYSAYSIKRLARMLARLGKSKFKKPGQPFNRRRGVIPHEEVLQQLHYLERAANQIQSESELKQKEKNILKNVTQLLLHRASAQIANHRSVFDQTEFSLIHFDLQASNIMVQPTKRLRIIDWGSALVGDPAMQIARYFSRFDLSLAQQRIFLEEYRRYSRDEHLNYRVRFYLPLTILDRAISRVKRLARHAPLTPKERQGQIKRLQQELKALGRITGMKKDMDGVIGQLTLRFEK